MAKEDAWFSYYYWDDDRRGAGFRPVRRYSSKARLRSRSSCSLDPKIRAPKLRILWRLAQKRLGFRMLMDVVPLDPTLVGGSHGARPARAGQHPVFISSRADLVPKGPMDPGDVYHAIKRHLV